MLSIMPGGKAATKPKGEKKSHSFTKRNSRLLAPKSNPAESASTPRMMNDENASFEELEKMLEDDALALTNMRKDISNAQNEELSKLKANLMAVQKDYDTARIANEHKEHELKQMTTQYDTLIGLAQSTENSSQYIQNKVAELKETIDQVNDALAAEQRTMRMQELMIKRIDDEASQLRIETAKTAIVVEHNKHDAGVAEANLTMTKQELLEEEMQLEKLTKTVKDRAEEREAKLQVLRNLSRDGENAVTKLQVSLESTGKSSAVPRTGSKSSSRGGGTSGRVTGIGSKAKSMRNTGGIGSRQSGGDRVGSDGAVVSGEGGAHPDMDDDDVKDAGLTTAQIQEVIERYKTQSSRVEKLLQLDQDLRHSIANEHTKKHQLSEHLEVTIQKIEQLASSRQIYQEVDLKDFALAATSKECEDCKNRDFKLRLNIQSLRQSIPRFLTKITKMAHPKTVPEVELGDAVNKLEDEIAKLIKVISSALLKDATPDDLALMSQQQTAGGNADATSEFGRLQRLPGYSRLQRQLYFNLMTARPDNSDMNMRVENVNRGKQPKTSGGENAQIEIPVPTPQQLLQQSPRLRRQQALLNQHGGGGAPTPVGGAGVSFLSGNRGAGGGASVVGGGGAILLNTDPIIDDTDDNGDGAVAHHDGALDRHTIKSISKLIYERDAPKIKDVPKQETTRGRR